MGGSRRPWLIPHVPVVREPGRVRRRTGVLRPQQDDYLLGLYLGGPNQRGESCRAPSRRLTPGGSVPGPCAWTRGRRPTPRSLLVLAPGTGP
ncbi:hypothetical protein NDU88_002496 [Pleurodeles waltl]|uniref:Uncharacterized protein n=1 Tax=Pleurodeles waltl TaxID=8319 RepID=A0AAV7LPG2_PLEWA|nr:hypothetical protein NDU88_002496 [Pleurodeles waltl]